MRGKGAGYRSIRLVVAIFQHKKNKICTSRGTFTGDGESAAHAFGGEGEADGNDAVAAKGVDREGGRERDGGQE